MAFATKNSDYLNIFMHLRFHPFSRILTFALTFTLTA